MQQDVGLLEVETEENSRAVFFPMLGAYLEYQIPEPSKPQVDLTAMVLKD